MNIKRLPACLNYKKLISAVLCVLFLAQQTMFVPVIASEITGVEGTPIEGGNQQFDIRPEFNHGDTGFRHYNDFKLDQGDIANLIFALKNGGDISKFVNLVDSQIIINGIVNSVLNNGDFNPGGHVIFVSPNGMVVGASGVLNVGALTAIAPTQSSFDAVKEIYTPNWETHREPASPVLSIINGNHINEDGTLGAQRTDNEQVDFDINSLKLADQTGDVTVNGKIFARDGVEITARHIKVAQDKTVPNSDKAAIFAGISKDDADKNMKIASAQQAKQLFNALVNNNIENGAGFANENGKIVIKAQSVKNLTNESGAIDELLPLPDESGSQDVPKDDPHYGDYIDPEALEANSSSVVIEDAVLGAHDIDISATTNIIYNGEKGAPSLNYITNPDATAIGQLLTNGYVEFEGARAKATVTIGSGAELVASGDVLLSSLAQATTNIKSKPLKITKPVQIADVAELFYAVGTQTESSVNVESGAKIVAGEDFVANATSKNTSWVKIKNPTTMLDQALLPNWQTIVVNTNTSAVTNAIIAQGADITAANVEVDAVNVTNDFTNISSKASYYKTDSLPSLAIAAINRNANIETNAKIDTTINTNSQGNVSVNAQNVHVASTVANASVGEAKDKTSHITGMIPYMKELKDATKAVQKQISGILGTFIADAAPNASGSVVINNSNVEANASLGANAQIHADNVNVNANTVDLTVNNSTAKVKDEKAMAYMPVPGAAVIVNNQHNITNAVIENGTADKHANITVNNGLNVNSTLEQPLNERTFKFLLDIASTGTDIYEAGSEMLDAASGPLDITTLNDFLMTGQTESADIFSNLKNLKVGFKLSGATSNLGLKGFFNNWAESSSASKSGGIGVAGSFVMSEVINDTIARIGENTNIDGSGDVIANAANKIVQNNAAGDVTKLWKLSGASGEGSGLGGSVIYTQNEVNAKAQIADNVTINTTGDVGIYSASEQSYINLADTGAATQNGLSFAGSVVLQELRGITEASVGSADITANNLIVSAGKGARFLQTQKYFDRLKEDPFASNDPIYNPPLEEDELDLSTPAIYDIVDLNPDTGLIDFDTSEDAPTTVNDGISNIMITGALSQQKNKVSESSTTTSSSGMAVGASVGVSDIHRNVRASIADGAQIAVNESVNVNSETYTQGVNVSIAAAFAGGVSIKKDKDKNKGAAKADNAAASESILDKALTKADSVNTKVESGAAATDSKVANASGKELNDRLSSTAKNDLNKASGESDGLGNKVAADGNKTQTGNATTASKNMSAALAGTVNVQMNESAVESTIGSANITVGKDVNVTAKQDTGVINIATGVAKAATVGAGAAINLNDNNNTTSAIIGNDNSKTSIIFNKDNEHNLNVKAEESNDNIHAAIGVGVTQQKQNDNQNSVSIGGSFNADVLENKVSSVINNTDVSKTAGENVDIDVVADNYSSAYKGAGGLAVDATSSSQGTSVGAGVAGNINIINKTTTAAIKNNSNLNNANSVDVLANSDKTKATEDLLSVGAGGSVIAGGQNSFSFVGAIGADVINNNLSASIENSTISALENINVSAFNNLNNDNIAGALSLNFAAKGASTGIGTVVNVITTSVDSAVKNSTITQAKDVSVNAENKESLDFLAVNLGASKAATDVLVNAIVNVLNSTINSSIADSSVTNSGNTSVIAGYDSSIRGMTDVLGLALEQGNALGGNAVINVMDSTVSAQLKGDGKNGEKKIASAGEVNVKANSNQNIDIVPVGVSISTGGTAAVAANVGVNVISNTTSAKVENANLDSGSLTVEAIDTTTSKSRGGTLAVSGKTAGVGGSVLVEVLDKDVDASVKDSTVKTGNLKVNALAENIFGSKETTSITADAIVNAMGSGSLSEAGVDDSDDKTGLADWQMTYDLAGGAKAGVSGSLIAKVSQNQVNAAITGSDITAQDVAVKAENGIYTRNIVGNITAGGNAAVGGSMFVNVNTGNTDARIEDSVIASDGDVLVQADSIQDFKTIMVVGGAGGTAAVNGSVNSNTAKDTTTALIKNSDVTKSKSVTVQAKAKDDVESINLAAQGAGTASVGGIVYNNNYLNTVNAGIEEASSIASDGKVTVDAKSSESFSANVAMIGAGGTASVNGVAIVNVINSNINSYINNSDVKARSIDVFANHNFNKEKYGDKTNVFTEFMDTKGTNASSDDESIAVEDKSVDSDDLAGELLPTVIVLGVSAAGTAAISANTIVDTINAQTIASVSGSEIATVDGLNIQATADEVLYNALAGVAASGTVSAGATVNTNVLSNTTKAKLADSTVNTGDVSVNAVQNTNLNTVLFMASGAGSGASVNGVVGVNTISNNTTATINNSKILAAENTKVSAETNVQANSIGVAGGGVGVGASVNGLTLTNVSTGSTLASIENNSVIEQGAANVSSSADTTMYNLIVGGSVAGTGGSVGVYAPVNVLNNNVNAYISGSKLNNNTTGSKVSADSDATLKTLVAVAGVAGIGGSVGASALVNVIDNDVLAYVLNSTITGGDFAINAEQNSSLEGLVAAVQAGGIAAAATVNVVTNTLNDRVKAYADNLISTANLDIDAVSTERIAYDMAALSGSGVGVTGAAIVNVISNQLEAYITNSELNGGSADIDTNQTITLDNVIIGGSVGAVAVGGGTIVNAVSNGNSAYVKDTYAEISSVSVNAQTTENITSDNIMASVSGTASGAVSALVNVLEGTTQAYIDAGSNNITSSGAVTIEAKDTLTLNNLSGSAAASVTGSGAASVNVNVINNAVKAELLSANDAKITAGSVDVTAISNMTNNVTTSSLAGGLTAGVAGTVSVTSIGDRFSESSTVSSANADDSVKEAQNTANAAGSGLKLVQNDDGSITVADANSTGADYKNYETPEVSLTKGTATAKEGTVANISANVETTGDDINVKAENTVNNTVKNATGSAGSIGVGASVMVTDTNYNTSAQITDGTIKSAKNINVNAKSDIKATTEATSASAGAVSIGGNVAYFSNNAITEAIIGSENTAGMTVNAKDVNITAESVDNISSKAIGGSAGLVSVYAVIALADANNEINAAVLGDNLNLKADNLSVKSINTSDLTSEMAAGGASQYGAIVLVNEASSNAVSNAVINATGNIELNNDLNVVTETGHINTTAKVALGSIAVIGGNAIEQKAESASVFNSKINSETQKGLKISSKNANVKAGLKKDTNEAGDINAKVEAVSAGITLIGGTATIMKADAAANTNVVVENADINANESISLKSALDREASSSSEALSIGGITIGVTTIQTIADGDSVIDASSGILSADNVNISLSDTASTNAQSVRGSISLADGSGIKTESTIQTDANIKTGSMNANNIDVVLNNTKTANVSDSATSGGVVIVGASDIDTKTAGNSGVETSGTIKGYGDNKSAQNFNITITDNSEAENEVSNANYGVLGVGTVTIDSNVSSTIDNLIAGDIHSNNISIQSNLNRTSTANGTGSAAGLSGISVINMNSTIGQDSTTANGATTTITAAIADAAGTVDIDSNATNTAKTYVADSTAGLIAIAHGTANNNLNSVNTLNIQNADIDIDGTFDVSAKNTNNIAMTKRSSGGGFIAVKGGELKNNINSNAQINIKNSNINVGNMNIASKTEFGSVGTVQYDDSDGGFITESGAKINNTINQKNNVTIDNSILTAEGDLTVLQQSDSDFHQAIKASASGFLTYKRAESVLNVINENVMNITEGTEISANDVFIELDSNNNLSSKTDVSASHFAGYPKSHAYLTLSNKNHMTNNGTITSSGSTNIAFLKDSKNTLTQDAYLHAQASIAVGSAEGSLTYNTDNKLDIGEKGIIASDKDVIINFDNGTNSFNARTKSVKVSRLLFGIPITDTDERSNITKNYQNAMNLDGEVSAGIGSQKYMQIDKDGNIVKDSLKGFSDKDYKQEQAGNKTSAEVTKDAIDSINVQKDYIESQITALEEDKAANQEKIEYYQAQIDELQEIIKKYENTAKISESEVNASIENNIKNNLVSAAGQGQDNSSVPDSAYDTIKNQQNNNIANAEKTYNDILNDPNKTQAEKDQAYIDYQNALNSALENALNEYKYEYEYTYTVTDDKGNTETKTETRETALSQQQKDNILALVDKVQENYTFDSNGMAMYNGKIVENDSYNTAISNVENQITDLKTQQEVYSKANEQIADKTLDLKGQISDFEEQIAHLEDNPLDGMEISNAYIEFDDIITQTPKIEITGIKKDNLTGDGKFKIYLPGLTIDNYSNSDLIFNVVNLAARENGGLTIGGVSFDSYLDTGKPIADKVLYVTERNNDAIKDNTITINNYFDHNNPLNAGKNPSDIIFNNIVSTSDLIDIWNESGDITFKNALTSDRKSIIAAQGNIVYDNQNTDFALNKADDRVIAGQNITINAKNIKNNGTIKAGRDVRNITITDDMLNNLVYDPTTGKTNLISLGGSDKSAYLNDNGNNIKAIYEDGKIKLFVTSQDGGNVDLNGTVTGSGTVSYTNGYSEVKVTNNTDKTLVINDFNNNKMNGTLDNAGTLTVNKQGKDSAVTTIVSNGKIETAGVIQNGKDALNNPSNNSVLTLQSENGVLINALNDGLGNRINTIDSVGLLNVVNNNASSVTIDGTVQNTGDIKIQNSGADGIVITKNGVVNNNDGNIELVNNGNKGIAVSGTVYNANGSIKLDNQNTQAGILLDSTGFVHNDKGGDITIQNIGANGAVIQGIVQAIVDKINLINSDSDILIGDDTTNDKYLNALNNDINITITNGDLLNSGVDKTLIAAGKDLNISVTDGDIGTTDNALAGKKPGFGINASTRDKTESININVKGKITAKAENNTKTDDRLINLTAKDSDMKLNQIKADGNVILTAAEWDTEDRNPTPGEYDPENYFTGYSIINAADDKTQPNIIGKNISLISSNDIGSSDNYVTYEQTGTDNDYFSAEAENDLYVQGMGDKSNIWQLISKRGNIALSFDGDSVIRELTSGKDIQIVSKGKNLTIYDIGRVSHILDPMDDLLYPHDRIELSSVVPETVNIAVLDAKGGEDAYSTLNIYNAFVKGTNDDKADVTLKADKIIAHAAEAADSVISNAARPNGFDASEGRDYHDDLSDDTSEILFATGFNTSGDGAQLTFDVGGVSPELVAAVNEDINGRGYNSQEVIEPVYIFNNEYGFKDTVYKANDVTLSLNSSSESPADNRGMYFDKLYTDNAYIDTKDLNLNLKDAFVTNYAEFRNGNLGASPGGHIIGGDYRWLTIVDNDYQRNLSSIYGINLTSQLYTKLTGSFGLHMGDSISQLTKAPVVYYNPYVVVNIPQTENSFYRLTYKDDKIQKTTTTPEFEDINKDTYKPTKRQNIRFSLGKDDKEVQISNRRIISIIDISKGGLAVEHDGSLKKGEEFVINLSYHNVTASPEVRVVRVSGNKAGLQFINLDNATANKILYINLSASQENTDINSSNKATMIIEKL